MATIIHSIGEDSQKKNFTKLATELAEPADKLPSVDPLWDHFYIYLKKSFIFRWECIDTKDDSYIVTPYHNMLLWQ